MIPPSATLPQQQFEDEATIHREKFSAVNFEQAISESDHHAPVEPAPKTRIENGDAGVLVASIGAKRRSGSP